jgi:hypothetical protein
VAEKISDYPAISYMELLESCARSAGINIPFIHNNPNMNTKSWSRDYGAGVGGMLISMASILILPARVATLQNVLRPMAMCLVSQWLIIMTISNKFHQLNLRFWQSSRAALTTLWEVLRVVVSIPLVQAG